MEELNKEFPVSYYIFEEIIDYVELTTKGYSKCMKCENIRNLLKSAVINNNLTEEQAHFWKNNFTENKNRLLFTNFGFFVII